MKHLWMEVSTEVARRLYGWDERTKAYVRAGLKVVVSDDEEYEDNGERWRHVSFSRMSRLPDWGDMKLVREEFFPPDAEVISIFPPEDEYKNHHPFCLHFWWNKNRRLTPKITGLMVAP